MEADREATPTLYYIRTTRENICSFYNFITRARGLFNQFKVGSIDRIFFLKAKKFSVEPQNKFLCATERA